MYMYVFVLRVGCSLLQAVLQAVLHVDLLVCPKDPLVIYNPSYSCIFCPTCIIAVDTSVIIIGTPDSIVFTVLYYCRRSISYNHWYPLYFLSYTIVDPSILILGTPDSIVFPAGIRSAVNFSVFASSDVETVRVTKDGGESISDGMLVRRTFVSSYNHYYEIIFYRPNNVNNGKYQIEATVNQRKIQATFNILISNCKYYQDS